MPLESRQCGKKRISIKELDKFYSKFVDAAIQYHSKRHELGDTTPLFKEDNQYSEMQELLIEISRDRKKKGS